MELMLLLVGVALTIALALRGVNDQQVVVRVPVRVGARRTRRR